MTHFKEEGREEALGAETNVTKEAYPEFKFSFGAMHNAHW